MARLASTSAAGSTDVVVAGAGIVGVTAAYAYRTGAAPACRACRIERMLGIILLYGTVCA